MKKLIRSRMVVVPIGLLMAAAVSVPAAAAAAAEPAQTQVAAEPAQTQALGGLLGVPANWLTGAALAGQTQETTLARQWQRSIDRVKHCTVDGCATDRAYASQKGHAFEIMDTDARNWRRPWQGWKVHESPNEPGTDAVSRNGDQIQHKASSNPNLQKEGVEACKTAGGSCKVVVPKGDAAKPGVTESKVSQKRIKLASTATAVAESTPELLARGATWGAGISCTVQGFQEAPKLIRAETTPADALGRIIEECVKGGLAGAAATGATIVLTSAALPAGTVIVIAAGTGIVTYWAGGKVVGTAKWAGGKVVGTAKWAGGQAADMAGSALDHGKKAWNHIFGDDPKPRPHGPNLALLS